jgi:hypothetical protein
MTRWIVNGIVDCPYSNHFTDSRTRAKVESHGKIRPQAHTHNHRNRKHPPSIVRTGCAKALCWGAKGKRGFEVPGLSAHGTIDNLQLVFPEIGRAADRPRECSE